MLLNALWKVPDECRIHDLDNRTVVIDAHNGTYGDASVWGRIEHFSNTEADTPCVLREVDGDQIRLVALVDKPLKVEVWDSDNDEVFGLDWDGIGWSRGKALDEKDFNDSWLAIAVADVENLVRNACLDLGFNYLDGSSLRSGTYQIELIERPNFSMLSICGRHVLYHGLDDTQFTYTVDHSTVPPIEELNAIQCPEEGIQHNTIYVLYDEEDGPLASLNRIFKRNQMDVTTYANDSDDIVDMKNFALTAIETDGLVGHIYLIYCDTPHGRTYQLFINMERFEPTLAPYLSS